MTKPTVFIGSSAENRNVVEILQELLEKDAFVQPWSQIFGLGKTTLEGLLDNIEKYDFGIFIFAPDDISRIRGEEHRTVRDNVVFELGLFVARLGPKRSFVLMPGEIEGLHLPTDLLGLTVAQYDSNVPAEKLMLALGPACNKIRRVMTGLGSRKSAPIPLPPGIELVDRNQFRRILEDRLLDSKIQTVRMVTYTSQVDGGILEKYSIKGPKRIEIYKRSILSDLAEEQEYNVQALASGRPFIREWQKRKISMDTSDAIEKHTLPPGSTIVQYLYEAPPSKRAYMFDRDEAVIAFYEVHDKPNQMHDSLYAGMTDSPALHVKRESPLGKYLLDELENHIAALRRTSHLWEDEKEVLRDRGPWKGYRKSPCIKPRAVFLDLDGVLYDSLPLYVEAWQTAFASVGVIYPKEKVYLDEGRDGRETIRLHLAEVAFPNVSAETIESIYAKNVETLRNLPPPQPMKGATDLLRAISKAKIRVLVVTGSTSPEHVQRVSHEFEGMVKESDVITGKDIRAGKPDPDPYLLACKTAKVQPYEAIVIENAPLGIRSADVAGTFCIAVNTGPLEDSKLKAAGARAVFDSCSELAERWDEILKVLKE